MASIKVKFQSSVMEDCQGTICYHIFHDRKSRKIVSDHHVYQSEWDADRSAVCIPARCGGRMQYLLYVRDSVRCDLERLNKIIRWLEDSGSDYTADDVVDEFRRYMRDYSLLNYMESRISKLKRNGKVRTSETYAATLNSFRKFLASQVYKDLYPYRDDIMLDCLTSGVMEAYEVWHRSRGIAPNTISFYARILRAAYNRAVEDGIIENRSPFRHVYTGVDKTVKRALPLAVIKKIRALDLSRMPSLDYARDMFVLSFMLRGMSFIDMAYLRKTDLANGYITYRRRKTGQQLTIAWTKEMQLILDKYPENQSKYLLPIIRHTGTNERYTYRNVGYNINHSLKAIGRMVGLTIPLTLYVARHSWASAAKAKGIPLSVISEGMGHDSEATTQIYLASLDTSAVDRANTLILKGL